MISVILSQALINLISAEVSKPISNHTGSKFTLLAQVLNISGRTITKIMNK